MGFSTAEDSGPIPGSGNPNGYIRSVELGDNRSRTAPKERNGGMQSVLMDTAREASENGSTDDILVVEGRRVWENSNSNVHGGGTGKQ